LFSAGRAEEYTWTKTPTVVLLLINLGFPSLEYLREEQGGWFDSYSERESLLLTRQRRGRRKQTKLPHHSNIVPIRKVLSDLAIEHPIHVDVLNLESAPGGLHTHEHSAIDRKG